MQVSLKLVGILQDYYPDADAGGDGAVPHDVAPGTNARAFLNGLGIPDESEYFIMIDDELVEAGAAAARPLADGNVMILVPVIKGG